jgi:WD40 repeat protein
VTFAPDDRRLIAVTGEQGGKPAEVVLWEVSSGQPPQRRRHGNDDVLGVAFAPDGKSYVTAGQDGFARVWDADSGRELQSLPHSALQVAVAFSPDGQLLAVGGRDKSGEGVVQLWCRAEE